MTNTQSELSSGDGYDLPELLARLFAKKWWVAGSVLLITSAFAIAAALMTPVYRAEAVLAPSSMGRTSLGSLSSALGQLGGLASLMGIAAGAGDGETEVSLAVLRSRHFFEAFLADKNLMPVLYADKWDNARRTWKVGLKRQPTTADAFRYFDEHILSIIQDKKTELVHLRVDWKNRDQASEWANDLVQRINAEMRARAIAKADASIGYLQTALSSTVDVGTRDAINRLIESQVQQRMLATVTQEYAFRIVDRAMVPDQKDPVSPKTGVLVALGLILGLTIGCATALVVAALT